MARRKKTSPLEDFLDVVAMLPWWLGAVLAFASYVFLHRVASPPSALPVQPGQMMTFAVSHVLTAAASVLQYVLPAVIVLGALISFLRRKRRQTLLSTVSHNTSADALDHMSWREFELLVGEAFRLQGYKVTDLGGDGPDGGIDLMLSKGSEKFLVQCKQWKAFKVGVTVVRELYGVMAAKGAAGGFVVTSGRFTAEAIEFASGRNIKLVDGPVLWGMIQQAKTARGSMPASAPQPSPESAASQEVAAKPKIRSSDAVPDCPSCGVAMKLRTATRGNHVGKSFWGCTTYPACKGTRDV